MDYLISLHSTQSSFEPEDIVRLLDVTEEYAQGYKKAYEELNPKHNVYMQRL